MRLQELQRAFQARILSLAPGVESELADRRYAEFEPRLDAYVDGYRLRLVEALGSTYPVLQRTLGSEAFARQMRQYIDSMPSHNFSVRAYGADVGKYLATHADSGEDTTLAELARWEWLLAEVFDAPDDDPLEVAALATVPPAAWANLSFTLRASLRRFETTTNIVEWWRAANGLCDQPAALIEGPSSQWLLWRRGVKTVFRSLDEFEAPLLDAVAGGATFGELCEQMAQRVDAAQVALRAASLLRGWIAEELIASHVVAPADR
jgi:hypothetical protein